MFLLFLYNYSLINRAINFLGKTTLWIKKKQPKFTLADIIKNPETIKALENMAVNIICKTTKNSNSHRWFLVISLAMILSCVGILSFWDKMNPSSGVILGALAGYLFGRKDD